MFISVKRQREKQAPSAAGSRLTDAILDHLDQGVFVLDGKGRVLPQVSRSLATLFQREEFLNLTFEKMLAPILSAKALSAARSHIAALLNGTPDESRAARPLEDVEVRLSNPDGTCRMGHYWFDFDAIHSTDEAPAWLVRVTDITLQVHTLRELDDLRAQGQVQAQLLRGVLLQGGPRFGAFLQCADAAMNRITAVLKKPARADDAFRGKLEELLAEVDRIRLEAGVLQLTALESSARLFEEALQELRGRASSSGSDFLPLTVKLDHLYGHFALVKSLAAAAGSETASTAVPQPAAAIPGSESPRPGAPAADLKLGAVHRTAGAGSLDSALQSLKDHIAEEQNRSVVLENHGLDQVPPRYQAAVKNIAVQFIRNAVVHGIEALALREAAGKAAYGTLRLEFKARKDRFELLFEDDGRGLDPHRVRAVAVERGVLSGAAAAALRDREAIKLIFKSGFTTLAASPTDRSHGAGLSLVRRYIHQAGGKVALASVTGRETRFKLTLPALAEEEPAAAAEDSKGA